MFFLLILFLGLLHPISVQAVTDPVQLCGFWPNYSGVTKSYVEVCNTGSSQVDLSTYSIYDSAGNSKVLTGTVAANSHADFDFSNYLNISSDVLTLKNNNTQIDSVSYSRNGADPNATIDLTYGCCGLIKNQSWASSADFVECIYINPTATSTANMCPIPTATPAPPTPTLTPTPTTQPSATSVPLAHISINLSASTFKISQNYSYTFSITSAVNGDNYAVKAYGGVNDNYGFENQEGSNWENYTSDWSSYTTYNTQNNTINNSGVFRVKSDEPTGSASLHFKCRDITTGNDCSNTSDYTVNIQAPNPTPTPTPIINTPIPTPTDDPNITPTDVPSPTFEPSVTTGDNGLVQGVSATDQITPVLTPTASKSKSSLAGALPFILIGFGGLLLCVPLIITKLKH